MKRISLVMLMLICALDSIKAQQVQRQGWFFLTHTQKLSSKFDLLADVQLRSADKWEYLNTLLLRGAFSYNFNKSHSLALGYANKQDWELEDGKWTDTKENRIYQQYLYQFKIRKAEIAARLRLEQRFVKQDGTVDFSQRGRMFVSAQIPLLADSGFTKGLYAGIQNEIFLNIQHKQLVNNSVFDQNRSFVSAGYRWSKNIDTEFGYMFWFNREMDGDYRNHIFQVMVTTSF